MINKLFSHNLITLNLSNNQFSDIIIFNEKENLINLKELYLSYNKITKIDSLANCKFLNLINLDLSHNEIDDISCLENQNYFNNLQKLDLSFNKIKKLNKIDIKTLNYLNLVNNEISEGILDFNYSIKKLVLTKKDNEISFKYYKEYNENDNEIPFIDLLNFEEKGNEIPFIDLLYLVEKDNINDVLKGINFKGINILELYGFDDLEFLTNESLSEAKILNCKSNIDDISVFNNIKFINIDEIKFNTIIKKGFSSLNIFKSIKINKIDVSKTDNNNYCCNLESEYPKINNAFTFNDVNFLKEQFLSNTKTIIIARTILDNKDNFNFFSYNEIINSFPIFKNLKAENIIISNHSDDKFICTT